MLGSAPGLGFVSAAPKTKRPAGGPASRFAQVGDSTFDYLMAWLVLSPGIGVWYATTNTLQKRTACSRCGKHTINSHQNQGYG
jgi:hypothetical protein